MEAVTDREGKNEATFITVKVSACRFSQDADRFEDIPFGNVVAVH